MFKEAKNFVEYKSMAALVRLSLVVRKITVNLVLIFFGLAVAGGAMYALVNQLLTQYNFLGQIFLDPIVSFSLLILVGGALFVAWMLRERHWVQALGIDKKTKQQLRSAQRATVPTEVEPQDVSLSEIRAVVEEAITRRLEEEAKAEPREAPKPSIVKNDQSA